VAPDELERVDVLDVGPGASAPFSGEHTRVPAGSEHVDELRGADRRVVSRVVELPELRVRVGDLRDEGEPGLRILAAEAHEACARLVARSIWSVELVQRRVKLRRRCSVRPPLDDAIEVAGPILAQSEHIDEATLMEGAKTKSQDHLLAISRRPVLVEALTDVLVERGNELVAQSAAENPGAKFSEFGYSTLVKRSEDDPELALRMLSRPEIPRQHLLKLFADASETVRLKLAAADHRKASLLRDMVAQASNQIQTQTRERSADFVAARAQVQFMHETGKLTKSQLETFASEGKFDETLIALSLMCDLSIGLVERAMVEDRAEQILVLAKAIGLPWSTTSALLLMQAGTKGSSAREIEQSLAKFNKLQPETAKKAVQFYRLRERATMPLNGLN